MSVYKKLADFHKHFKGVNKNAVNPHFKSKYADLDEIIDKIKPCLDKVGLGFSQMLVVIDGKQHLKTIVFDEEGHTIESELDLSHVSQKAGPHGFGSAITYARRYSLASILGVVEMSDDDGNQANQDFSANARHLAIMDAVRRNWDSINAAKEAIANNDIPLAKGAFADMSEEDKDCLWVAPTKGGVFTTQEREALKNGAK